MISAAIFDLDGTVLANEDEYGAAFRKVLARLGKKVYLAYPHIGGIGVKENWPILLSKYKIRTNLSLEELTKETQEAYLGELDKVKLKPGLAVFIRELYESGIKIALATSNTRRILDEVFERVGLQKFFEVTTTGEEVELKKPAPDLFLLTANKLRKDPSECLVFEDSKAGIAAAHSAGMRVVAIARDQKHAAILKDADLVSNSYSELSPASILNL